MKTPRINEEQKAELKALGVPKKDWPYTESSAAAQINNLRAWRNQEEAKRLAKQASKTPARRVLLARIADREMAETLVRDLRAFNGMRADLLEAGAGWNEIFGPATRDKAELRPLEAFVEAWVKGYHAGYGAEAGEAMDMRRLSQALATKLEHNGIGSLIEMESTKEIIYEAIKNLRHRENKKAERVIQCSPAGTPGGSLGDQPENEPARNRKVRSKQPKRKR